MRITDSTRSCLLLSMLAVSACGARARVPADPDADSDTDGDTDVDSESDSETDSDPGCGPLLWERNMGGAWNDAGHAVAADGEGNVLVAGYSEADDAVNAFVRKYDPDGNELWTASFEGDGVARAWDVATDASGHVIVAGVADATAWVRSYDVDGGELWTREPLRWPLVGCEACGLVAISEARGVATDAEGNVFVTGRTEDGSTVWLAKYDADGNEVWVRTQPDELSSAVAIAPDRDGDVWVVGGGWIRKHDPDGNELWKARSSGESSTAWDVTAADGAVFVTSGAVLPGEGSGHLYALSVSSLDLDAGEIWSRVVAEADGNPQAGSVAVDADGNVVVSTYSGLSDRTCAPIDVLVRKYDRRGSELWTETRAGAGNGGHEAVGVAFDPEGNVLVTADAWSCEEGRDVWVGKYCP